MTRSKPNTLRLASMVLYLLLVAGLIFLLTIGWWTDWVRMNVLSEAFLTVLVFFALFFFILIELPIVLALKIDENKIVVKNLLTRKRKEFFFESIHGFQVSTEVGIFGEFHVELILLKYGEPRDSISLQYILNVDQIINQLEKKLRNATEDEYGFLQLIRGQRNN